MNCKGCEYPLWNLTARKCPECGLAFRPSEFEFVLNSVCFSCPHCRQDYYGTDAKGHLDPAEFDCVRCGKAIGMDDCILFPTGGVLAQQTQPEVNPWIDRRGRSWIEAWFATISRGCESPTQLIAATPPASAVSRAFWFAVTTYTVYSTLGLGWVVFAVYLGRAVPSMAKADLDVILMLLAGLLVVPALFASAMLLWIASVHAVLRLSGPTAHGFGRTAQAIAYSSGVNFVSAIPCLSVYVGWIGWIWWMIGAAFMIREGQKVTMWRAGLAVAAFPVTLAITAATGLVMILHFFVLPGPD